MATTVGYLTGVPGVCVSTVGPGATNLTTGVGSAWLDRAPVLAITCNVAIAVARAAHPNAHRSPCALQAADQGDFCAPRRPRWREFGAGAGDCDRRTARPGASRFARGHCRAATARSARCRTRAWQAARSIARDRSVRISTALRNARRPLLVTGSELYAQQGTRSASTSSSSDRRFLS